MDGVWTQGQKVRQVQVRHSEVVRCPGTGVWFSLLVLRDGALFSFQRRLGCFGTPHLTCDPHEDEPEPAGLLTMLGEQDMDARGLMVGGNSLLATPAGVPSPHRGSSLPYKDKNVVSSCF